MTTITAITAASSPPPSGPSSASGRPMEIHRLVWVFVALLGLLFLSAGSVWLPAAPWKSAAGFVIAAAKTTLIGVVFMKLGASPALIRLFAFAGLFWLALLAALVAADYATRVG